jgi:hypothetical protein
MEHDMSDFTTHEIERSLERDRLALAQSLVDLRDRLRPAALMEEGKAALMAQARPMVSPVLDRLDGAVRAKPVAAAVAGLALAALLLDRKRETPGVEAAGAVPAMAGTKFEALTRWEDEGGPPADAPVDPDEDWLHEARGVRNRAERLLAQIDDAARRGLAPASALAKHRADVLSAMARETTGALGKGLESLTEGARSQALQARERVYLQKLAVAEKGRAAVEGHPLATGVVMAGLGALAAWLFPPTEIEDNLMGETRDWLLQELNATLRSEVASASALAQGLSQALGQDIRRVDAALRPEHAWSGAGVRH